MKLVSTPCIPIFLFLVVLTLAGRHSAGAHEGLQRGGVDRVATDLQLSRFSLDLTVGIGGLKGFDDVRGALTVTPRFDLRRRDGQLYALTLPLIWMPEEQTHSNTHPLGYGGLSYEEGPSLIFAPSIEWYSCPQPCLRSSMFFGAGVRHDKRSSPVLDLDDETSAVVTLGFAVERPIQRKLALRFEIRALTTLYQDEHPQVGLRDGPSTSLLLSAGLKFSPRR